MLVWLYHYCYPGTTIFIILANLLPEVNEKFSLILYLMWDGLYWLSYQRYQWTVCFGILWYQLAFAIQLALDSTLKETILPYDLASLHSSSLCSQYIAIVYYMQKEVGKNPSFLFTY